VGKVRSINVEILKVIIGTTYIGSQNSNKKAVPIKSGRLLSCCRGRDRTSMRQLAKTQS